MRAGAHPSAARRPRLPGMVLPLALLLSGLAAGCSQSDETPPPPADLLKDTAPPSQRAPNAAVRSDVGTPLAERVATIGLLNKRNNITEDIQLKPGEAKRIKNVVVKLESCERTPPWESPPETGAFVQVLVAERRQAGQQAKWRQIFSGWLFKNSPSLNVVEHPIYDVWVKDCAMNFPGEEPAPAAADNKAA